MAEVTEVAGFPRVIENPLSGERIVVTSPGGMSRGRSRGRNGDGVLAWELLLSPGGRVPNSHVHPLQEERFYVRAGQVRFRVGWHRVLARPGDAVVVPPGRAHHFANAGPGEARMSVETRPALRTVEMFEAAAAMAREQQAEGRAIPRLADVALFMREFEAEVASPYFPRLVRFMVKPTVWFAGKAGRDVHYRRLRRARLGEARA